MKKILESAYLNDWKKRVSKIKILSCEERTLILMLSLLMSVHTVSAYKLFSTQTKIGRRKGDTAQRLSCFTFYLIIYFSHHSGKLWIKMTSCLSKFVDLSFKKSERLLFVLWPGRILLPFYFKI